MRNIRVPHYSDLHFSSQYTGLAHGPRTTCDKFTFLTKMSRRPRQRTFSTYRPTDGRNNYCTSASAALWAYIYY